MTEDLKEHFSGLWTGLRKKAMETVAAQEAAYARGKTAATPVIDDDGQVIVEAGHQIDDAAIDHAYRTGRLHALAAAAVKAGAQDIRERAQDFYSRTPEGIEAHSYNSIDAALEARRYVGRVAGIDVTDTRGNVIVPAGRKIQDSDVDKAREAAVLGALVYSAQQPAPELPEVVNEAPDPKPRAGAVDFSQLYAEPAKQEEPVRRARLPLMPLPEPANKDSAGPQ